MGWETKANGQRYYYRSRRIKGRIKREYVGGGLVGELAEQLDDIGRCHRRQQRKANGEARALEAQLDTDLIEFDSLVDSIGRGMLIAAGLYQHNRGNWRKRNEPKQAETPTQSQPNDKNVGASRPEDPSQPGEPATQTG